MTKFLIKLTVAVMLSMSFGNLIADNVAWYDGKNAVTFSVPKKVEPVVHVALDMFSSDMEAVTGKKAVSSGKDAAIRIVQLDCASGSVAKELSRAGVPIDELKKEIDGFHISVIDGQITVVGANGRGAAYGILELSRMAGVSPWIWWGDLVPEKKQKLTIDSEFKTIQGASVEYRGIFLNDEDWTIRPWSYGNYEPRAFGDIGPKTYKKIFQLLMRLRANAIWPGMHTGTTAFFKIQGAKAVADSCGIVIGTSHCEPLLRNNVDEWDEKVRGKYNYMTNRENVHNYWIERLEEVKNSKNNMFTIGMRGIHDGSMEGVKTMQEKFDALQLVIDDQQQLIGKYIGDPSKQIQVFVPYKEVLEIYERGLKVPDYVTLMWCDDNYGYMTRLSDEEEQKRAGGGGVYYHLSYWGRPHDYMWLTTTQPGLIYNEMKAAYNHNVRKIWIVNVHDPKVAGYDLELFLDMAWDIHSVNAGTINDHYKAWLCRQFGKEAGERLFPAMHEFYRLCGERHPEFMGWNQVEVSKVTFDRGLSQVRNTAFSTQAFGNELDRYLERYESVCEVVEEVEKIIRPELNDAYFAAIKYPVLGAAAHATKILEAQRARQIANGSTRIDMFSNQANLYIAAAKSQKAYQDIRQLTEYYNEKMAGGKWRRNMHMRPRDLPVFGAPVLPTLLSDEEVAEWLEKAPKRDKHPLKKGTNTIARNAYEYESATAGTEVVQMLGHSMNAVALPKDGELSYRFTTTTDGEPVLRVALIPTQPNDDGDIRFSISVDGGEPTLFTLKEKFRSEGWKQNVLRGQAVREVKLKLNRGEHTLKVKAIDDHVIIDQWMLDYHPERKFYLFPIE